MKRFKQQAAEYQRQHDCPKNGFYIFIPPMFCRFCRFIGCFRSIVHSRTIRFALTLAKRIFLDDFIHKKSYKIYPDALKIGKYSTFMQWLITQGLTAYPYALNYMADRVGRIAEGSAEESVWLVEHPPLYTGGTSAKSEHLLNPEFPVFATGRGGQYTYHGPGQRVAYIMLNLKVRYSPNVPDVRHFVATLEQWLIDTLNVFGIKGERRAGRIGIWVAQGTYESKIAALGIRISRGVSLHGIALNVNPDLSHFEGIVPCGIREHGVTSLHACGVTATMSQVDKALKQTCPFILPL